MTDRVVKLCVDCLSYDPEWAPGDKTTYIDCFMGAGITIKEPPKEPRCRTSASLNVDLVTGARGARTAREMRYGGECGASGVLWEAKP